MLGFRALLGLEPIWPGVQGLVLECVESWVRRFSGAVWK